MSVTETSNDIKKDSLSQDKQGNLLELWHNRTEDQPKILTHICYAILYCDHADNVIPTSKMYVGTVWYGIWYEYIHLLYVISCNIIKIYEITQSSINGIWKNHDLLKTCNYSMPKFKFSKQINSRPGAGNFATKNQNRLGTSI